MFMLKAAARMVYIRSENAYDRDIFAAKSHKMADNKQNKIIQLCADALYARGTRSSKQEVVKCAIYR